MRGPKRAAAAIAIGVTTLAGGQARAGSLHDSIERLADAWRAVGASVVVDRTRFLLDDDDDQHPVVVTLPELPEGACTTIVLLGSRGLSFHVRLAELAGDDAAVRRLGSVAGALSIQRCGEPAPGRLAVVSDSGRGAFETLVARSAESLPALRSVLPERTGSSIPLPLEPGRLPPVPPPDRRADVAETRARRDGASIADRVAWPAGPDGAGRVELTLEPGCHALQLIAMDPRTLRWARRVRLDLDAEMRAATGDRLLARDRSDAPDAALVHCVGTPTRVQVVFAGSPPDQPVLVTHAVWPLPPHLPALWGDEARARMAHVLLVRHVGAVAGDPVMLAQGGYGITPVPLSLEPGGCYLAVVALAKEEARSIGLRVHVGSATEVDDRGIDDDGAAAAFCAGDEARGVVEVEARGTPLFGWGLALWRLQSDVWQVRR